MNNLRDIKQEMARRSLRTAPERAEERRLLALARSGDRTATRRLLERLSPPIYRFGRRFCRNTEDAEDVMQEVLSSLARSLPTLRGDASLTTWAYAVARNACIRHQRRAARPGTVSLDRGGEPDGDGSELLEIEDSRHDPHRDVERRDLEEALGAALHALPAPQREALILRDIEGLPAREVARVLGVQERAVKSRLHRARTAMRDALAPHVGGADAPPRGPHCPDVAHLLSRYIEGELDASRCASLEAHVRSCGHCGVACRALRRSLGVCRRQGSRPISRAAREALRRAIRAVIAEMRWAGPAPRVG
jgi:RNA polymerase sigma-70 factor, ECF subfamily